MQDATASAAAARVDELEAQMHEEQAGAAEQRAILQQLQRHLRGPAGTGTQEGTDQQTLAAEVIALVHQQQEESQQQLAAQSAAAAEQAAQFETALKQQAAAAASAAKLEEQTATLEALCKQQEQQQQDQQQATAKLEAQLEKEKAERQAAAGALAKLEALLSDRASEQQAAAASAAELHAHVEKEAEHQAVVAALKESLSHYKAAAQLAHERVSWTTACVHPASLGTLVKVPMLPWPRVGASLFAGQAVKPCIVLWPDMAGPPSSSAGQPVMCLCTLLQVLNLEGQRAAADKQWQERLAGEQASSQQHHLRAGRMEVRLPSMLTKHVPRTPADGQKITSHLPSTGTMVRGCAQNAVGARGQATACRCSHVCQCLASSQQAVLQLLPALTYSCAFSLQYTSCWSPASSQQWDSLFCRAVGMTLRDQHV